MAEKDFQSNIEFFVNGTAVEAPPSSPARSLLDYLRRDLGLTGAKLGCAEGGCGACSVIIQNANTSTGEIKTKAINACLAPLASVHGSHIITPEGLGSSRTGIHVVQQRIADFHGSQCGFCTPGIAMALAASISNSRTMSTMDLEHALDGNLCRCTGYRPILDAAKSFAVSESKSLPEHCKSKCARSPTEECSLPDLEDLTLEKSVEFPKSLLSLNSKPLIIRGSECTWFRPVDLNSLLELKREIPEAKLIAGNTEVAIETRFKGLQYPVRIHLASIPELKVLEMTGEILRVGGAVELTALKDFIQPSVNKFSALKAISDQLKWFASTQVRNVAVLSGNIVTASPISDMNPVLQALGASVELMSWNTEISKREIRWVKLEDFFLAYRKVDIRPWEIISAIEIPFDRENEFSCAFKQARRREDDIAIVSSGMRARFEAQECSGAVQWIVKEACLSFGGMAEKTIVAKNTCTFLCGKPWTESTFQSALERLSKELYLPNQAVGGQVEYRRTLSGSFFLKFYVKTCEQLKIQCSLGTLPEFVRPVSRGIQEFQESDGSAIIGKGVRHSAAYEQVSGEALYVDDYPLQRNEVFGAFALTSKAHCKIISIDWKAALNSKGVISIYGADDVPGQNTLGEIVQDEQLFVKDYSPCVGSAVAIVVAETLEQAENAAKLVKIQYEELPGAIFSIQEAIANESFLGPEFSICDGSIEEGFKNADFVFSGEMRVGGQEHFYLETQASIAYPGEAKEMKIISSTQNPRTTQEFVAHVLGISNNQVVCTVKRMGGGFGGKETRSVNTACAVAVAAYHLRRPVRMMLNREVDMTTTGLRHAFFGKYTVGIKKDGQFTALDLQLYSNGGFSYDLSVPVIHRSLFHSDNAYKFPNIRVRGRVCKTHLPSNTAFRGFGGPQGMLICENIVDHCSREIDIPPETVRQINMYKHGDSTHFGQLFEDCTLSRQWEELKTSSQFELRHEAIKSFNKEHQWRKRGIAMIPTKFGISFTATHLNQGAALVHIYTDGTCLISHGGTEMGQGLHTKMRQVAAHTLGIPLESVYISETSTDKVANSSATAASQGSDINGEAVKMACEILNDRLESIRKDNPNASFAEIAHKAYFSRIDLSAHAFYKVPNIGFDFETRTGRPFNYFTSGVACSEVEIDILTGDFHILRTDILMDLGKSLNPHLDIGQIEGAFTQGLGWLTTEEVIWGDSAHTWIKPGNFHTRGPGAYKIPSFNDVPIDFRVKLLSNSSNKLAIHSSRAVGEPPLFLASTVFFALKDGIFAARSQFGLNSYFAMDSPATSERIRMQCGDPISTQFVDPDNFKPCGSF